VSVFDRAMQAALSAIGINSDLVAEGVLVSRGTQRVLVALPQQEVFSFDESIIQECDRVIIVALTTIWKASLVRCPQLATKVERAFPDRGLVSVLVAIAKESLVLAVPDSCTIDCIFTKQMDRGIEVIRHDMFGTLSTFGVGKRIMNGTATSDDFPVFEKRLAATMCVLAKQAVDCSFISIDRHSFPHSMSLLIRMSTILESPDIDARDLKHVYDELRSCLSIE
jgi:hypothetical protein